MSILIFIFLLKLVAISLVVDTWLYWLHRAYHSEKFPQWFRKIHNQHHVDFLLAERGENKFSIHPVELLTNISLPFFITWWLINPWFYLIVVAWGLFEAARGHGQYWWFKLIPAWWYRKLQYAGYRYHSYHHTRDATKNLGQFLRIWDRLCGTEQQYQQHTSINCQYNNKET